MSKTVAKRSAASEALLASAAKGRALMGGSDAMRAAGKAYLPKFSAESAEAYDERTALSWLFNGYRKTVRDMTGRVFALPITPADDVPSGLVDMLENADLQGRDLSTFARSVFEDGLSGAGISFIMVEAPWRPAAGVTKADVEARNLRPYLVHLRAEDVLGWKTETIDNITRLSQLRLAETINEQDPKDEFAQVSIDQVRVLDRLPGGVQVRLFQKGRDDEWNEVDEPSFTGRPEITVIPFYANRTAFFSGSPLLDDLADVNIAHWQSQSDQRQILHVARVPILFGSGLPDDKPIVISTSQATISSEPTADLKWVEHSGAAIGAGRQDLKDLEFQMEAHGLQLLVNQAGGQSATGAVLDAAKETSILSMTADALQDCLEQALQWMADYSGEKAGGSVKVNKDFAANILDAQELQLLLAAVNTGNMSRETFISTLVNRGIIADSVTPEDEAQRIEDEGGNLVDTGIGA